MALALEACGDGDGGERASTATARTTLTPTPECRDGDEPTPEQTEGPYYTPETPRRTSLIESGVRGERLTLAGTVLDTRCRPVRGALLDFWQADGDGEYDNEGFRLRGHQLTDGRGRYRLETVVPGPYPGRTPHIHVKAAPPRGDLLTTQIYFPGEPGNDADSLFDDALLMSLGGRAGARRGRFDFVLA
jgi:protocatechuate 3,4-dioxygenase beta subunit